MANTDWDALLRAWLHDPPDKVLDIPGHKERAKKYLAMVTGLNPEDQSSTDSQTEDIRASVEDRLPFPRYKDKAGNNIPERMVDFGAASTGDGSLVRHPLSGAARYLDVTKSAQGKDLAANPDVQAFLKSLASAPADTRFFALWRFMPEIFAKVHPQLELLPAETRAPDHTIWNHLDLTAAFEAALADNRGGALLSFTVSPVQSFIEASRSVRDLWTSSYLLSWLTLHAMGRVVLRHGPTAVIFPSMRGNALFDWWMQEYLTKWRLPDTIARKGRGDDPLLVGSLPNTFLALVPLTDAEQLARDVRESARSAWTEVCHAVRTELNKEWDGTGWDAGWDEQVSDYFDFRVVTVPRWSQEGSSRETMKKHFSQLLWCDCWPSPTTTGLEDVMNRAGDAYPSCRSTHGAWAMQVELAGRVMAANKQVRQVPPHTRIGGDRAKCTMLGTLEQMGPGGSSENQRRFWEEVASKRPLRGTHVRTGERLSAVGLVKRFAWPAFFADELDRKPDDLRYSDTATVAAKAWLKEVELDPARMRADHKDWSGQWLFGDPGPEEQAPPGVLAAIRSAKERAGALEPKPKLRPYYAAFVLDGDEMGKWLRGEKAPTLAETYHPAMLKYFESLRPALRDEAHALLAQKRPPSPAMHAALTAALGNYARDAVPPVLRTHHGELVYAGGDDVLGLLPVETALPCLRELRERYTGRGQPAGWEQHDGRDLTLMGDKATASAGVAIAHHKMDLREVLQAARAAEKAAKNAGRDALGLAILKRSGDHTTVVCPWDFVFRVELFAEAFSGDASDRWAYRLRSESEALLGLRDDLDALSSIIKQTVEHGSKDSKETIRKVLLVTGEELPAGQLVAREFRRFCETWKMRESRPKLANPLEAFIQLVQAASFLARGRDE